MRYIFSLLPSPIMFCLTIHKVLNLRLFQSSSLDIFTSYKLEDIHSAGESRQVFHTFLHRWITCVKLHAVDVDKREGIMAISLRLIQYITTVQVDIDDTFLMVMAGDSQSGQNHQP